VRRSGKKLVLVLAGWYPSRLMASHVGRMGRLLAPSVRITHVDGRSSDIRRNIWYAADIFLSLVDNVQESFGLTPVEAMAAGLPSVVSDWDGYRDTVRDKIDGFRIATTMPPPNITEYLLNRHLDGQLDHDQFVGTLAQTTAINIEDAIDKLVLLGTHEDLRISMGRAAKERAGNTFEWRQLIGQYSELVTLKPNPPRESERSFLEETSISSLFSAYSSRVITDRDIATKGTKDSSALDDLLSCPSRMALPAPFQDDGPVRRVFNFINSSSGLSVRDIVQCVESTDRMPMLFALGWLTKNGLINLTQDFS